MRQKSKSKQAREVGTREARRRKLQDLWPEEAAGKSPVLPSPFSERQLEKETTIGTSQLAEEWPRKTSAERVKIIQHTCGCRVYQHRDLSHFITVPDVHCRRAFDNP